MPDLQHLLDQIQRLDQEATKGPWVVHPGVKYVYTTEAGMVLDRAWADQPDADLHLAALARTALPQLAKAVRRVAILHQPVKTGVESNGVEEYYCPVCAEHAPCYTYKTITDALGADHA